uniref:DUF5734 domain-containing protein n=1 Tax=Schistocephalus solidus TaxID=70667 RepID=A0A0X3PIG5_SCHSO
MAGGENERAKILQTELEYLKVKKLKQKKEPKELQQIAKKALKKAVKGKPVKALFVFFPENFKLKISGNKKLKSTGAKWSDVKKVLKSQPAEKSIVLIYSGEAIVPFYVVSMRFKTEEGFEETIKRVSTLLAAENGKQPAETKKEDNETVAPLITTEIHASGKDIDTTILQEQGVQSTSDSSTVSADDLRQGQRSTSTSSSSTSTVSQSSTSRGKSNSPLSKSYQKNRVERPRQTSTDATSTTEHMSRKSSIQPSPAVVRVSFISTDPSERPAVENLPTKKVEAEENKPYKTTYITGDANRRPSRGRSRSPRNKKEHGHPTSNFPNYAPTKGVSISPEGNTFLYCIQHRHRGRSSSSSSSSSSSTTSSCSSSPLNNCTCKRLMGKKGSSGRFNGQTVSRSSSSNSSSISDCCKHDKCQHSEGSRNAKPFTIRVAPFRKSGKEERLNRNQTAGRAKSAECVSPTENTITTTITENGLANVPCGSPPNMFLIKDEDAPRKKQSQRACSHGRPGAN